MSVETSVPPPSPPDASAPATELGPDALSQNIETILAFYTQEEQKISRSQRFLENISEFMGRPLYLGALTLFVALWIVANIFARQFGWEEFDSVPFSALQGILGLGALLTTMVVLIKQNRQAKLGDLRAHLDLQINLLTEQKTSKLIKLMEELRHDLPMVKNREDPEAAAFLKPADPQVVLAALDAHSEAKNQAAPRVPPPQETPARK